MNRRFLLVIVPVLAVIAIAVLLAGSGIWSGAQPQTITPPLPVTTPTSTFPQHHINPEYFRYVNNQTPKPPVPETERVTIVLSRTTFDRFTVGKHNEILRIPIAYLDFENNFVNTTTYPTWHYENGLTQHDRISVVRMPATTYDSLVKETRDGYLALPVSSFVLQSDSIYALRQSMGIDGANESVVAMNARAVPSLPVTPGKNQTATPDIQITPTIPPFTVQPG